jgi:hypothetical protein
MGEQFLHAYKHRIAEFDYYKQRSEGTQGTIISWDVDHSRVPEVLIPLERKPTPQLVDMLANWKGSCDEIKHMMDMVKKLH